MDLVDTTYALGHNRESYKLQKLSVLIESCRVHLVCY